MDGEERGVSPVIGVILMVAIVVILAAFVGSYVLGIGQDKVGDSQAGPYFATDISEEVNYTVGCSGSDSNKISLTNEGGDTVPLKNIKIQVTNMDSGDTNVFRGLPIDHTGGVGDVTSYIETTSGSDFIWGNAGCFSGPIIDRESPYNSDKTWSAGQTIGFQLTSTPDDGDKIQVTIVDTEQNLQIDSVDVTYRNK